LRATRRRLAAIDAWQRRHRAAAFLVAVFKKFADDGASRLAALIAYYAFVSLFPLLLVFVSVLGFVLEDDPSLQAEIVDSALARIPVIGVQLRGEVAPLTGSAAALVVGLVGALWAGLGVTVALGRAFQEIWDVPRVERRGSLRARARGAVLLGALGLVLIGSTALTAGPGVLALASLAGNVVVFFAVFALLTERPLRVAELAPGVGVAAVGSLVLQSAGAWYVERVVADASETYGTFALVIGLLSWFWLGAHLLLVAAEVNVVRHRRLWPRSLTGTLGPADLRALERAAQAARLDRREEIVVRFRD
jgi:YihY family inner membrane protein